MSAQERDFGTFYFMEDNVYELAGELIPEIAERLEVPIADEPNNEDLQRLMGAVGRNKVLRANGEIQAIHPEEMADIIERSGVQNELRRSLWTPEKGVEGTEAVLAVGGVANWQDRTARIITGAPDAPVHLLGGSRIMDTATEKSNPNIARIYEKVGFYPSEAQYMGSVVLSQIVEAKQSATVHRFDTDNGDLMLEEFFKKNPALLKQHLLMARVANAGVVMALQMRNAARKLNPTFDSNPADPQVVIATDSFPVAHTEEQRKDVPHYQNPATALRQVVLTAAKIHEAVEQERGE